MTKLKNWSIYKMKFDQTEALTYYEVLDRASSFLRELNHSSFVAEWLMRERLDWSKTELVMQYRNVMPVSELKQFERDFEEFLKGLPMQQIIGHEWFHNRKFKVTEDTLIPRPETEEWLEQVLTDLPQEPLSIVDIGTGTGIIGLTVKLERPADDVTITDISKEALDVAKENAQVLGAEITAELGDLFEPLVGKKFDAIISNPPYISEAEINVMDQSVLDYEPKSALFADEDGLAIYKRMAESIEKYLKPNGRIYLEIGYQQGDSVSRLFKNAFPDAEVTVWQDFNQLDRVVAVEL